jgi:hypothetical protein
MVYKQTKIDEVISRIIRNTRLQDSSYIDDFNEWIPEAMAQLQTSFTLSYAVKTIPIKFHKGRLPCDMALEELLAVEYNGTRLPYSSTVKNPTTGHNLSNVNGSADPNTTFQSVIVADSNNTEVNQNNIMWSSTAEPTTSLTAVLGCDVHPTHWYATEPGWLVTSIADGCVTLHYKGIPLDDNGLPYIPDNENYKEAIYLYVRAKMIGAGYNDKVYKEDQLMQRFEVIGKRAINEITYPTPDMKEQQLKTQVRFIPPANYYDNFFRVDNHEPFYPTNTPNGR